jgi:hypothetical protein
VALVCVRGLDLHCNNDRFNDDSAWWLCCNIAQEGAALGVGGRVVTLGSEVRVV